LLVGPLKVVLLFLNEVLRGSPVDGTMELNEDDPIRRDGERECEGDGE